jgi:pimeloyl-ACP methyl ester carboxylesterase
MSIDNSVRVAHDDTQGLPPILVFIHGFLDGAIAWDEVVAALGERTADAVCVDLAGMGERADEDGPYSLDRFADDVAARVGALPRPVVLVGHSMGAQIAELVAGRLTPQVCALALLTPVPLRGTRLPDEIMQSFHALGGNPVAQRELRRQYSVSLDDARHEKLASLGNRVKADSVGVIADLWNAGHPLGDEPTRYAGPVLLVSGHDDAFVTGELIANAIAPHFDNPTLAVIDHAGHWPHVEQPASVAATLGAFLAEIESHRYRPA